MASSDNRGINTKMQQTQDEVNQVVAIMKENVTKVIERDEKLSELDKRADNLQHGAMRFEQQATRLKRKYWWKNLKMMIIIGIIVGIVLIIIIVSATSYGSSETKPTPAVDAPSTPKS